MSGPLLVISSPIELRKPAQRFGHLPHRTKTPHAKPELRSDAGGRQMVGRRRVHPDDVDRFGDRHGQANQQEQEGSAAEEEARRERDLAVRCQRLVLRLHPVGLCAGFDDEQRGGDEGKRERGEEKRPSWQPMAAHQANSLWHHKAS
jgi:hypothetical protein